jgi:two-component system, NarL family, response regulator LiaR
MDSEQVTPQLIKLLIVDDHAMVREGLKLYLSFHPKIEVIGEAANGLEALEVVAKFIPDVILMDVIMPTMDGIEAIRLLQCSHPLVRVIALTSTLEEQHLTEAMAAGAVACLLKTTKPEELLSAIYAAAGASS